MSKRNHGLLVLNAQLCIPLDVITKMTEISVKHLSRLEK